MCSVIRRPSGHIIFRDVMSDVFKLMDELFCSLEISEVVTGLIFRHVKVDEFKRWERKYVSLADL